MKKMIFALLCAMGLCGLNANASNNYVDLGLPSGTLWAAENVEGYFPLDLALQQFGTKMPSKEQWEELKTKCQWAWHGSGFMIIGPNGNFIELPAAGAITKGYGDVVHFRGDEGYYWSSSEYIPENEAINEHYTYGWDFDFRCDIMMDEETSKFHQDITYALNHLTIKGVRKYSVRLVQ